MGKKIRSARGVLVDFDLIKIKQQIASAPKPVDVSVREEFVDRKIRRRIKRKTPAPNLEVAVEDPIVTEDEPAETLIEEETTTEATADVIVDAEPTTPEAE